MAKANNTTRTSVSNHQSPVEEDRLFVLNPNHRSVTGGADSLLTTLSARVFNAQGIVKLACDGGDEYDADIVVYIHDALEEIQQIVEFMDLRGLEFKRPPDPGAENTEETIPEQGLSIDARQSHEILSKLVLFSLPAKFRHVAEFTQTGVRSVEPAMGKRTWQVH